MRFLCALLSFLVVFLGFGPEPKAAEPEPEICRKLKEISSRDPDKELYPWTRKERCRNLYWLEFKPKPLSRILTVRERRFYSRTLAANDCASATRLLQTRFVEAHPEAPSILRNPRDYKKWKSRVLGLRFPRLYLCLALQRIRRLQEEIDRLGLKVEPFAGFNFNTSTERREVVPQAIYDRNHSIYMLHLSGAITGNQSTNLTLLKMSFERKILHFHPHYEVYLALTLHEDGIRDPVIEQVLSRPLDEDTWKKLEGIARSRSNADLPHYP